MVCFLLICQETCHKIFSSRLHLHFSVIVEWHELFWCLLLQQLRQQFSQSRACTFLAWSSSFDVESHSSSVELCQIWNILTLHNTVYSLNSHLRKLAATPEKSPWKFLPLPHRISRKHVLSCSSDFNLHKIATDTGDKFTLLLYFKTNWHGMIEHEAD